MSEVEYAAQKARKSVNRAALVCRGKRPFFDWLVTVNEFCAKKTFEEFCEDDYQVYLVEKQCGPERIDLDRIISDYWPIIVEMESWSHTSDDDTLAPVSDQKTFTEWFEIELHTSVTDLIGTPIISSPAPIDW